jgi:hypothetical protein
LPPEELALEQDLPERVAEALEEADFYLSQELFDEAREVLFDALGDHPRRRCTAPTSSTCSSSCAPSRSRAS